MNEEMVALIRDLREAGLVSGEGNNESPVELTELGHSTLSVLIAAAGPADVLARLIPLVNFYHMQFLGIGTTSGMGAQDEVDDGRAQG
jgi:hypothetical protein